MKGLACFVTFSLFWSLNMLQAQSNRVYDPEINQFIEKKETKENKRRLRYYPDGEDFVIINGNVKFNRALYGTHSAFRIETGDLPEFALYLPRMGGNLSFILRNDSVTKKLNDAAWIESRYRAGTRIYTIRDKMLGKGEIMMQILALADAEGMVIKISTKNIPGNIILKAVFGGASDVRFSREGDLGVDPEDSFELKPEYCKDNVFQIDRNSFSLRFGNSLQKQLTGIFPANANLAVNGLPVLESDFPLKKTGDDYLLIQIPDNSKKVVTETLPFIFNQAEEKRKLIAGSLKIYTPDPYFNTLGSAISIAADAIWDGKVWLHGAVGWRMPLNGWRAAYTGDVMGWHDRARAHFNAYAASQVNQVMPVIPHPAQDSALNLARSLKKWGTPMYSNGYICRNPERNDQMHHYDMNLVYMDELLWHFNWTGDISYMEQMWPVIEKHLAWEKRNFDPDDDGLYDAYCCIWASDALYYNSGGVTHASAYNFRANKMAALIAGKLGKDAAPYRNEAAKILNAINQKLWIKSKGHWAEFVDLMGNKMRHDYAAIWTIYHAIDSDIHDILQGYQSTRYVDTQIPHIAVEGDGIDNNQYHVISTSSWMPYAWSINNVVVAENNHMALAYWQAGRNEEAFNLMKSVLLDNMYMGKSPGNVGQISHYDAARGECYRDFGDPVGITSRALVQGLFGIYPDAINNKLVIKPGFPDTWNYASFANNTIQFDFKKKHNLSTYIINQELSNISQIELIIPVNHSQLDFVKVNGKKSTWKCIQHAVGKIFISISVPAKMKLKIEIKEAGKKINFCELTQQISSDSLKNQWDFAGDIMKVIDPQGVIVKSEINHQNLKAVLHNLSGNHTFFVELKNGQMTWIHPVNLNFSSKKKDIGLSFSNVDLQQCEIINIDKLMNDDLSNIFKNKYLSPRSPYTTLQIPVQGIGEWCHPTHSAEIDDSGLRKSAIDNLIQTKLNVDFRVIQTGNNIAFTSLWDNFPSKIDIPVTGKARNAYFMLAGTTNHMQYKVDNGFIIAYYSDGSSDTLRLVNPDNWCPIEQDFYVDNKAFNLTMHRPYRIHLKTGLISNNLEKDLKINGVYGRSISGGAGVLLDMPLDKSKNLQKIVLETRANEIIIGLMALTLQR